MRIHLLFAAFILFGCSSENPTQKIELKKELSIADSANYRLMDRSMVKGSFFTSDTLSSWYSKELNALNRCYCLLENDTLNIIVGVDQIFSGIYSAMKVSNGRYTPRILDSHCLGEVYFAVDTSRLALNSLQYNIGDTLIGEFRFRSASSNLVPLGSLNFEGKFQCEIQEGSW